MMPVWVPVLLHKESYQIILESQQHVGFLVSLTDHNNHIYHVKARSSHFSQVVHQIKT